MRFCLRMLYICECDCEVWERRPGRCKKFVFICLSLLVQRYTKSTRNFSRDKESFSQALGLQNTKQWAWFSTDCIFDIPWVFLIGSKRYTTSSITRSRTGHPRWIRVRKASPIVTVVKVLTFRYVCIIIFEFWWISLSKLPISSRGFLYVSCLIVLGYY
jgi:hypothetical protein